MDRRRVQRLRTPWCEASDHGAPIQALRLLAQTEQRLTCIVRHPRCGRRRFSRLSLQRLEIPALIINGAAGTSTA